MGLLAVYDGYFLQRCNGCIDIIKHTFGVGSAKTTDGPFNLIDGSTIEISIDGYYANKIFVPNAPITITFTSSDFPDLANVSAEQLAQKLSSIPGIKTEVEGESVLIESLLVAPESAISFCGGSAFKELLGFDYILDDNGNVVPYINLRPQLGLFLGGGRKIDPNIIRIRACLCCGAQEHLNRTLDKTPANELGTFGDLHRRAVNVFANHLKDNDWVDPNLVDFYAKEKKVPLDVHESIADIEFDLSDFPPPLDLEQQ